MDRRIQEKPQTVLKNIEVLAGGSNVAVNFNVKNHGEANMEFWLLIGGAIILYYAIKAMPKPSKQQVQKNNRPSSENEIRVTLTTSNRAVANSNDDDLAAFSISYGYDEEKSKNKTPAKWIKSGESITIMGYIITGRVYF